MRVYETDATTGPATVAGLSYAFGMHLLDFPTAANAHLRQYEVGRPITVSGPPVEAHNRILSLPYWTYDGHQYVFCVSES